MNYKKYLGTTEFTTYYGEDVPLVVEIERSDAEVCTIHIADTGFEVTEILDPKILEMIQDDAYQHLVDEAEYHADILADAKMERMREQMEEEKLGVWDE